MIYRKRHNNFLQKRERKKGQKKEVKFRSYILGNLWGQDVLLLLEQGTSSFDQSDWRRARARHVEHFRKQRTAKEKPSQVTCEQTTVGSTSLSSGWWKWPRKVWWPDICTQSLWGHMLPLGWKENCVCENWFHSFTLLSSIWLRDLRIESNLPRQIFTFYRLSLSLPWQTCYLDQCAIFL